MVSFELCKEIENDVSSSSHQHRTKKKIPSPHNEMNLFGFCALVENKTQC